MADRGATWALAVLSGGLRLGSPLVAAKLLAGGAFALLGLFVLERRLSGGLVPHGSLAAGFALALVAWGAGLRAFGRSLDLDARCRRALETCVSVGVIGVGLGLASADLLGGLVAAAVLLEQAWAWRLPALFRRERQPQSSGELEPAIGPALVGGESAPPPKDSAEFESFDEQLEPDVQQLQTRTRDESGFERVSGWQRVAFAAGAQSAAAHVAFCPPLERAPQLAVHQLEGPDAQIKVGVSQPFGARFDLRLPKPAAAPCEIVLEYLTAHSS
ncbi:MAG: hypothetical protein U0836_04085 [Pirellulales bacterium]